VRASKQLSFFGVATLIVTMWGAYSCQLQAQNATAKPTTGRGSTNQAQWSLQVNQVDPGDVNLAPSFRIAIYECLL